MDKKTKIDTNQISPTVSDITIEDEREQLAYQLSSPAIKPQKDTTPNAYVLIERYYEQIVNIVAGGLFVEVFEEEWHSAVLANLCISIAQHREKNELSDKEIKYYYDKLQSRLTEVSELFKNDSRRISILQILVATLNKQLIIHGLMPSEVPVPIGMQLWRGVERALQQPDVIPPKFDEGRQKLLQAWFVDRVSLSTLQADTGLSRRGVQKRIRSSLKMVFPYLPEDVKTDLQSPEAVLQATAKEKFTQRPSDMGDRISRGMRKEPPKTEKRQFSPDHHTHLSQGASRRWQRYHEEKE